MREPCMWVAGFSHQAGLVERMTSPAWRSPWLVLGSGVGEGSPGPDREELGGWDPSPQPGCSPTVAACGLAPEQGTDLPRGWHRLRGLFPAAARKVRGADVGLTSHPPPSSSASPGGSLLLGTGPPGGARGRGGT